MESMEAKILLKSLLKRIKQVDEDSFELNGLLTDDELTALKFALSMLESCTTSVTLVQPTPNTTTLGPTVQSCEPEIKPKVTEGDVPNFNDKTAEQKSDITLVKLDKTVLSLPQPANDERLCLDFGTAMSKVTLVKDRSNKRDLEEIHVLRLGVPGDQEEISETMLISSVFIDPDGKIWFGKKAQDWSKYHSGIQRLDNIKRYLSEEGFNEPVSALFNPTDIKITYGDMVMAYLMYLTWAVNQCLEEFDAPRNLSRRFAMPCLDTSKSRDTEMLLSRMLGEAQILADTFNKTFEDGIHLSEFIEAKRLVRQDKIEYPFINNGITEPLGVAGSIISWDGNVNSLLMVVDIGAGTSDFSVYRMAYNPSTGKSKALEVENSTIGITEAGNHLDKLLKQLILKKAGITSTSENFRNISGDLELSLRDYKERLFEDGEVHVKLFNDALIQIDLDEFMSLPQVTQFADSLVSCRDKILNRIDSSFITGAPNKALAVALTGGGASLPMVKALAKGTIRVQGKELKLVQTKAFPDWLAEEYPELEEDYPRIAVSLGGARKRIIDNGGVASLTAGGESGRRTLEGFYTKGH
ncbi:hypothetical protein [Shewanella xiamenensis]|uniref:hypothetical protein n=1 Tax=Shewanella xiamenensis TaxID=332186 RepID=UPI00313B1A65